MPNTNRNQAFAFLNELRKKANDTYINGVEGLPYGCLSFSAGIAECEKETYSISELLNKADQALYVAKNQGKNLVKIFNSLLDYGVKKSLSLEKELDVVEQQLKIFHSKDVYTYRHSKRVYQYAVDFSRQLDLTEHERFDGKGYPYGLKGKTIPKLSRILGVVDSSMP